MSCVHTFIEIDGMQICSSCGLEDAFQWHSDVQKETKVPNINNNALSKYLDDLDPKFRNNILTHYDKILNIVNQRGTGKRALLAVITMYLSRETSNKLTCKDVCLKFNIPKSYFSEAQNIFLDINPQYSVIIVTVSDFIDSFVNKYDISKDYKIIKEYCKVLDECVDLVNHNPHSVCACLIFKFVKNAKKNIFMRDVNISEGSFKEITHIIEKCLKI